MSAATLAEPANLNIRNFDRRRVVASRFISGDALACMSDADRSQVIEYENDRLRLQLEAFVLTEAAGDVAEASVAVDLPLRPWWVPRCVWSRMPTRRATWKIDARPEWSYPSSTLAVPALGHPVRIATVNRSGLDPVVEQLSNRSGHIVRRAA